MNVEALGVGFASFPGDDVRGPQESRVGNAGQGAAGLPVFHEARAEDVLADALDMEAFGFGGLGQRLGLRLKFHQRRVGQTGGEAVDARERGIERPQRGEGIAGRARARQICRRRVELLDDAGVIQRQEPGAVRPCGCEMDRARNGGRCKSGPAISLAQLGAEAVLPCGLVTFLLDAERLW